MDARTFQNDLFERSRGMTLQSRFMVYFGTVVISLLMVVSILVGHRQSISLIQQTEARGLGVAKSIAATVTASLMSYDHAALQSAAQNAKDTTGVSYVVILNKENQIGGFSDRPDLQLKTLEDPLSLAIQKSEATLVQRVEGSGLLGVEEEHLDIAVPVYVESGGVRWGTVRVGLSLSLVHHEIANTRRLLTLLGIVAVGIVLFAARIFTLQITRPLERFAHATTKIAAGDLDHAVEERPVGELRELARSFNKMTSDLKRSRDAIRYQNQHLENMVQERTAALREKARELERANAELLEVDRLKSDFLSNVSHELRTPLTSIRSFTEIMLDNSMQLSDPERLEFLGIVATQADRLTRLISDLLDLSKIEAGEFHCHMETINPHAFLRPCIETLRTIARDKDVALEVDVPDSLPSILGDRDRLHQVLSNLIDNALKFTPAGGTVRVSAQVEATRVIATEAPPAGVVCDLPESGEYLVVRVSDTGVGIPREFQQHIFEKFGQVGNVLTNKPQGTGLGLAISGSIMVQHSGALWVRSRNGDGSSFFFSIPVVVDSEALGPESGEAPVYPALPPANSSELVAAIEAHTLGRRVLVVDDEPDTVAFITELLEPLGFRAIGCTSGNQAVAKARDLRPDCIVLDSHMPEINGCDVLRLLKGDASTKNIPVVVMGDPTEGRRVTELGAASLVPRPETRTDLVSATRSVATEIQGALP
jgi:signal transduction histidine kinase/ActR/RegA family two-component response regulator